MSGNEDELDQPAVLPAWKRPLVWIIGIVGLVIIVVVLAPSPERKQSSDRGAAGPSIIRQVTDPYTPPVGQEEPPARPKPKPEPEPTPPPQPTPQAQQTPPAPQFNQMASQQMPSLATQTEPPWIKTALAEIKNANAGKTAADKKQTEAIQNSGFVSYGAPKRDPVPAASANPAPPPPPQTQVVFKAETIPGLRAGAAVDQTYLLTPGILPVVLDTAVDSDVGSGTFLAHLPGPVRAPPPKSTVLMERDTIVVGRYNAAHTGQSRIEAASVYAWTPNGVPVPLTGQAFTDDLGRNGLAGEVDRHFFQRFGASIMLAMTQQAISLLQTSLQKAGNGGNSYFSFSSGGGGDPLGGVAQEILRAQANQPPTFKKNIGETVAILIDQPVDFHDAYELKLRQ